MIHLVQLAMSRATCLWYIFTQDGAPQGQRYTVCDTRKTCLVQLAMSRAVFETYFTQGRTPQRQRHAAYDARKTC